MILTVGRLKSSGQTIALTSASSFLPAFLIRLLRTLLPPFRRLAIWRPASQLSAENSLPPRFRQVASATGNGSRRPKKRRVEALHPRGQFTICRIRPTVEIPQPRAARIRPGRACGQQPFPASPRKTRHTNAIWATFSLALNLRQIRTRRAQSFPSAV